MAFQTDMFEETLETSISTPEKEQKLDGEFNEAKEISEKDEEILDLVPEMNETLVIDENNSMYSAI